MSIEEKQARLEAARAKLEEFKNNGGDLKSPEAAPLGIEFLHAFADIAKLTLKNPSSRRTKAPARLPWKVF